MLEAREWPKMTPKQFIGSRLQPHRVMLALTTTSVTPLWFLFWLVRIDSSIALKQVFITEDKAPLTVFQKPFHALKRQTLRMTRMRLSCLLYAINRQTRRFLSITFSVQGKPFVYGRPINWCPSCLQ